MHIPHFNNLASLRVTCRGRADGRGLVVRPDHNSHYPINCIGISPRTDAMNFQLLRGHIFRVGLRDCHPCYLYSKYFQVPFTNQIT